MSHAELHAERTIFADGDLEAAFAQEWLRINEAQPGLLETLLEAGECSPAHSPQRDAAVAATVIQWLGTNVGFGFLRSVLGEHGRYKLIGSGGRVPPDPAREA